MGERRGSNSARERAGSGVRTAKLLIAPPRGQDPGEGRGRGCGRRGTPPPPVVLRVGLLLWGRDIGAVGGASKCGGSLGALVRTQSSGLEWAEA